MLTTDDEVKNNFGKQRRYRIRDRGNESGTTIAKTLPTHFEFLSSLEFIEDRDYQI